MSVKFMLGFISAGLVLYLLSSIGDVSYMNSFIVSVLAVLFCGAAAVTKGNGRR